MGQYYKKDRKIGTCESMYYMRLDEAQELAARGERDDDGIPFSDYLNDGITRFRFPFPEEDNTPPEQLGQGDYDKGFNIPAGDIGDVGHDTICIHNELINRGGHGINIFVPCPYSQAFKDSGLKTSTGGAGEQFLTVKMEGMRDSETPDCVCSAACGAGHGHRAKQRKTIFECSRCGHSQRFDNATVEKIKERAREYFKAYDMTGKNPAHEGNQELFDRAMKVIERIK